MGPPIMKLRETTSAIGMNYCLNKIEIIILTISMKVGQQTFEDNLYTACDWISVQTKKSVGLKYLSV